MPKITLIGAGSTVFTRNLCSEMLEAQVRWLPQFGSS
jgi:alpha-galactosidase/6-phospho-beta-glucosidase family protein